MLATELVCGIDYGSTIFFVLDQIIIKGVIIPRRGLMLVATDAIRGNDTIQNVRATAEIKLSILIVLARKTCIKYRSQIPCPELAY